MRAVPAHAIHAELTSVRRHSVVLVVWALMSAGAIWYVASFAHAVPYYDEWSLVHSIISGRSAELGWLWEPRNGHRLPVPKLVLLTLQAVFPWDFRAGMYISVLLLSAAAFLLVRAAAARRGASIADAILPLLLLNFGHHENLLWGWQVTQVQPIAVALMLIAAIVRWDLDPPAPLAILAAVALITLPLSGVAGLVFTPGLAVWLLIVAARWWRQRTEERRQPIGALITLAGAALVLIVIYFIGLSRTLAPAFNPIHSAKALLAFPAYALGPVVEVVRPWAFAVVPLLYVVAAVVTWSALRRADRDTQRRAIALLCAFAAFAGMVASVAVVRPYTVFAHRYYLFAVPGLICVYLSADLIPRQALASRWRALLLGLTFVAVAYGTVDGLRYARQRSAGFTAFETDLRSGMPPSELIARHQRTIFPFPEEGGSYGHDGLKSAFAILARDRAGVFAHLAGERVLSDVDASSLTTPTLEGDSVGRSWWAWRLPETLVVAGVRVPRPRGAGTGGEPLLVEWGDDESAPARTTERQGIHWWYRDDRSVTFWIYEPVRELRVLATAGATSAERPQPLLLLPR